MLPLFIERRDSHPRSGYIFMQKKCKTCKINKLLSEYDKCKSGKYGVQAHCKECRSMMRGFVNRDVGDLDNEIWVDIVGLEGYYKVSNKSRVKRLARRVIDVTGRNQNLREQIMKPTLCSTTGYELIDFNVNGEETRTSLHRVVASHFISNPENKPEVNHINGVRNDNGIENLEWATSSEQKIHAFRVLKRIRAKAYSKNPHLIEKVKGSNSWKAKAVNQIDIHTGEIIRTFKYINESVELGFAKDASSVVKCCKGKCKYHNNFKWSYA